MPRKWLPDVPLVIVLLMLPLAFFWQVTLGGRTLLPAENIYQYAPWSAYRAELGVPEVPQNSLLSDLVLENLPWKQFIRQSLSSGELPLWNPYLFAGVPFLAAGQHSALYPFSVIYYVLPLERAYGWFTVSQLWLAGLFMFLFMRGLGVRRIGAMVAAVAYQMSAFFLASVVFQMIIAAAVWLPFLLLMVDFTIQRRPIRGKPAVVPWVALGAVGLGMCILAGHVEIVYYTLLVMGFWAACRLLGELCALRQKQTNVRTLLRTCGALLALVVIGIGVGAVQFVPLFELASRNFREGSASFETVRGYAYPPRHAAAFLMPNLYGNPAQHDYFDLFTGQIQPFRWQRADGSTVTDTYWEVNKNYVEGACYVGLLTLALAAVAVLTFRRKDFDRGAAAILIALALISLSFMFGTVTYALLYYGLPGANQLHSPFRWIWPFTLALAALAGFGADALSRAREGSDREPLATKRAYWLVNRLGWGLTGAGLLTVAGLLLSRVFFSQIRGPLDALFHKLAGAPDQFPTVEVFYSVAFKNILLFGLMLTASGIVIRLSRSALRLPRQLSGVPIWEPLAVILIALDLSIASAGFNPASDPALLHFTPPAISWLKQQTPATWRFITLDAGHHPMNSNLGWLMGLQEVGGYDSIIPRQYVDMMQQIAPQGMLIYNRIAPIVADRLAPLDSALLDQLAVKYILSEVPIDHPNLKQVLEDRGFYVYENTAALPRAYALLADGRTRSVGVSEAKLNQVTVNTMLESAGTLILNDSMFPGWRAFVRPLGAADDQEKETPVELFQGNFRSVRLAAGEWTVRFRYTPQSVQFGAFGSFGAGILILFALLVWAWRRFQSGDAERGEVGRIAKNSTAPIVLSLFNRVIDFGFAVIMLRVLTPGDVGAFAYAIVVIGWFDILTNFGLNTFLTREVSRNHALANLYFRRTSLLRFGLALAWVPVLGIFVLIRQTLVPNPLDTTTLLTILLLYLSLIPGSLNSGLSALFYAFEKAEIPAAISTATAILSLAARLGVLLLGFGILGLAGASLALNGVTLGILLWAALPLLKRPDRETILASDETIVPYRAMIAESWPLMLNHLLATVFFKIDVVLLEQIKGKDIVAQYSVSYKWVDAIGVIPAFFTMAMLPLMSRQAQNDKPGLMRNYQLAVKLLVLVALPIAVVTTFLAPFLVTVLGGTRYAQDGTRALQLMIWFIPIGWINSLTQYVLIALNRQRPLRWPFVAGVLFNIAANVLFIPIFSYQAASVVTILSEVVLQIGFYILLRRALGSVNWFRLLARPALAAAVMFAMLFILWPVTPVVALAGAGMAYFGFLIAFRPFSDDETRRLSPLLPGPLRRWVRAGV